MKLVTVAIVATVLQFVPAYNIVRYNQSTPTTLQQTSLTQNQQPAYQQPDDSSDLAQPAMGWGALSDDQLLMDNGSGLTIESMPGLDIVNVE